MRHEYDTLIRHLADASGLDFYYVERMLKVMIREMVVEEFGIPTKKMTEERNKVQS